MAASSSAAVGAQATSTELIEALSRLCEVIQHLVESYDESREPDKLDMLVFQVDKLYSMLISLDICSNQVLDALCVSACLLQELNESSQNILVWVTQD